MKEQIDSQVTLKDRVDAFRGGNAEVVQLVREAIEDVATKRYNRALYPHGPEKLQIKWPGGYMAWYISYPKDFAEIFGSDAVANAREACAVVALDNVAHLVIGPNGAWKRDREPFEQVYCLLPSEN